MSMDLFLSTIDATSARPAFFELLMYQQIDDTMKPSFRHILTSLVSRYPSGFVLLDYFDELYLVLSALWERHHIFTYDSTFAERLYGLTRVSSTHNTNQPLSKHQKTITFLLTLLIPYLKAKMDNLYRRISSHQPHTTIQSLFIRIYPFIHASFEGLFLVYQMAYLFELTPSYTPALAYLNQKLVRISDSPQSNIPSPQPGNKTAVQKTLSMLRTGLVVGLLSYRLIVWLMNTSSEGSPVRSAGSRIIPGPPAQPQVAAGGIIPPMEAMVCPLCRHTCRMPSASPGGYIYCYKCLLAHVRQDPRCPVTKLPCTEDNIVRLFEQT